MQPYTSTKLYRASAFFLELLVSILEGLWTNAEVWAQLLQTELT